MFGLDILIILGFRYVCGGKQVHVVAIKCPSGWARPFIYIKTNGGKGIERLETPTATRLAVCVGLGEVLPTREK